MFPDEAPPLVLEPPDMPVVGLGGDCWAKTVEAARAVPKNAEARADVGRRTQRLLASFERTRLNPRGRRIHSLRPVPDPSVKERPRRIMRTSSHATFPDRARLSDHFRSNRATPGFVFVTET